MDSFEANNYVMATNSWNSTQVQPWERGEATQSFPQINPQTQSSSLERPQYKHLSGEYSKQYDDKNDLSYQVNSQNGSALGKGGITSLKVDEYLSDLLNVDSDDAEGAANSSLMHSDHAAAIFKDFAECINYKSINFEQHNDHVRTEFTQQMPGVPRGCLLYDEGQHNFVGKICGSSSQPNAASISKSYSTETKVVELSSATLYAPLNNLNLESNFKPILTTSHAPKFGSIGLHLNSIVNSLPVGCGATLKSADKGYTAVQGKNSLCTAVSHSTENAGNSPTSSKVGDGLIVKTQEMKGRSCASTACDKREYTKQSQQKKRKSSTGSSAGDGCKLCNCRKTKCLKLYCSCFASGYYCAETCSCQGCFNTPEYKDTVLETRSQILSRDPLAFAPKIVQRVGEFTANDIQDMNKSTPSSVRQEKGCFNTSEYEDTVLEAPSSAPHSGFHELGPGSSHTGLRSGCKYILKAVPSFPPLA